MNISDGNIRITRVRHQEEPQLQIGPKDFIEYNKQLITNMSKKKDQATASKSPKHTMRMVEFCLQEDLQEKDFEIELE